MGIRRAILKTDSQVISGHIDKSSKATDLKLEKYLDTVRVTPKVLPRALAQYMHLWPIVTCV
jgi:hypothetical protein